MSVMRVNKTSNYTVMSNNHFKEKDMSLKAKGLLSLMLSLPENWDYSINGLVAICKENQSAINSTLKELKEFGYLKVTKLMPDKTATGRIEYIYDIYEFSYKSNNTQKQQVEKQGIENLGVEIQHVENPIQLNTNKLNTNKSNTEYIYSPAKAEQDNIPYKDIILYLNYKINANYKDTTRKTRDLIKARFNEGFTAEDFKVVIDKKSREWLKDKKMSKFLRPETLFGTKFENYLNQKEERPSIRDLDIDISDLLEM